MPSLRDQFEHYYMPDEQVVATAIKSGLVAPDANVVLNLYRFQSEARDQLFGALEKLGDRLWIPHQVGLEFHCNRLNVMSDQEGYFDRSLKGITDSVDALRNGVRAFRARIALGTENVREIEDSIGALLELIAGEVAKAKESNDIRLDGHASDDVLTRIDALFKNRVGSPMEPTELEEARAEAKRRGEAEIPPGYKDSGKDKGDSAGDYLVWRQLMTEANARKLPVVFVTDDTKEDWYETYQGRTLGARRELRAEMMTQAGVPFVMMTTETFLRHAKTYLDAEVSDETVDQAQEILSTATTLTVGLRQDVSWFSNRFPRRPEPWSPVITDADYSTGALQSLLVALAESSPEDEQVRHETFEKYFGVKPWSSEATEAQVYIRAYLKLAQATPAEVIRAATWLAIYDSPNHGQPDVQDKPED